MQFSFLTMSMHIHPIGNVQEKEDPTSEMLCSNVFQTTPFKAGHQHHESEWYMLCTLRENLEFSPVSEVAGGYGEVRCAPYRLVGRGALARFSMDPDAEFPCDRCRDAGRDALPPAPPVSSPFSTRLYDASSVFNRILACSRKWSAKAQYAL